jgi:hypothetical protein
MTRFCMYFIQSPKSTFEKNQFYCFMTINTYWIQLPHISDFNNKSHTAIKTQPLIVNDALYNYWAITIMVHKITGNKTAVALNAIGAFLLFDFNSFLPDNKLDLYHCIPIMWCAGFSASELRLYNAMWIVIVLYSEELTCGSAYLSVDLEA